MPRPASLLPLALMLAACGAAPAPAARGAPVADLSLPPAPVAPVIVEAEEPEPQPARCTIRGTGELIDRDVEHPEFAVFTSRSAGAPGLLIHHPWAVHVTWSELPRVHGSGRARIALGGQKLLRLEAWAALDGRTFQIRTRADVHADHLWVRGGSPVEILGVEAGRVRLRAATPFAQPASLETLTACDNLAYQPAALGRRDDDQPQDGLYAVPTGAQLDLHAAPGGPRLITLALRDERYGLSLGWLEARDGFVRVGGSEEDIAFDAWVPAAQVEQPHGIAGMGGWGSTKCGGIDIRQPTVTLPADAEVRVGKTPDSPAIGVVEAGAVVVLGEERGDHVAFQLEEREIGAPEGQQMWVRKAAVGR